MANEQFFEALQEKEKEKSKGRNKKPVHESDTDSDSSIPEYDEIDHSYSEDDTEMLKTHKNYFLPASKEDGYKYLNEIWDTLNPPVEEENLVGKWYGALYHESKKIYFFIGKIVCQYLKDEDGSPIQLELDYLKRSVSSTATILEENPPHLNACGIFLMHNIISGPLNGVTMKGK